MRLLRKNAPSVPAALQRSASARSARFSAAENWRRLAIATTSGSGGAAALGIPSLALRAPSGTPRAEVEESLTIEDFITAYMSGYYLWTLNYRRQMSHCTLAQGGRLGPWKGVRFPHRTATSSNSNCARQGKRDVRCRFRLGDGKLHADATLIYLMQGIKSKVPR